MQNSVKIELLQNQQRMSLMLQQLQLLTLFSYIPQLFNREFHTNNKQKQDYTDLCKESQQAVFATGFVGITDLQVGPEDGDLYVLSFTGGAIYRIVPSTTGDTGQKLSRTTHYYLALNVGEDESVAIVAVLVVAVVELEDGPFFI